MIFLYAEELRAQGLSESEVREVSALRRKVWKYGETGIGYESAKKALEGARAKRWYNDAKAQGDDLFGPLLTPEEQAKPNAVGYRWFRQEAIYDPVPALRALRVPALFLFGDEDRLMPVGESVAVIQRVEREGGKKDFTIQVFPHVDHVMRRTASGERDPEYLATMHTWLGERVGK
jgi:pimeloyl-ACP methyl ester carboxylesterase